MDFGEFRQKYDKMSFLEIREFREQLQKKYVQHWTRPDFLLNCLGHVRKKVGRKNVRILELGGYDGSVALDVLRAHPESSWVNYDISRVALKRTRKELAKFDYSVMLISKWFYESRVPTELFDVFFSGHTLEHMRLQEVLLCLKKTENICFQVHIIDWTRGQDTHVLEPGTWPIIKNTLRQLGYNLVFEQQKGATTRFFAEKIC